MKNLLYILVSVLTISACSSVDCPLNNRVYSKSGFYVHGDTAKSIADTLTVNLRVNGKDTIILNKKTGAHDIQLPVSFLNNGDTLALVVNNTDGFSVTDSIYMEKTNELHFESVECGPCYFHEIVSVRSTNNFIDSVVVKKKTLDYDLSAEHMYIYLKRQ